MKQLYKLISSGRVILLLKKSSGSAGNHIINILYKTIENKIQNRGAILEEDSFDRIKNLKKKMLT